MTDIPENVAEHVLRLGRAQWGKVDAQPDATHVAEFAQTLKLTREHFGTEGDQELHGCYLDGTNTVLCHTGVSPNSPLSASILTGLWNKLHDDLLAAQVQS